MARILQINTAIYISIALGALLLVLFLRFGLSNHHSYIFADDTRIPVSVADTPVLREHGLSGTLSLAPHTGKLFIFTSADTYGFWMKDMEYPIDIVWIDKNWNVIDISSNVAPMSYPTIYKPAFPAMYVLEINANEATVDNLVVGTKLTFQQ